MALDEVTPIIVMPMVGAVFGLDFTIRSIAQRRSWRG